MSNPRTLSSPATEPLRMPAESSLLRDYAPDPGRYDEFLDAHGNLRAHWRWFFDAIAEPRDRALAQVQRRVDGMLRENGVTYNVYGDPRGMDRPWALDLLPVVIPASDWAQVEAGMAQRCRLLNEIAADLYGPQQLITSGTLRPEILFANPHYLRACRGIPPSRFGHIPRYSADLVRAPDGQWIVSADRLQAASGSGYAMENRSVLAQVFPSLLAEGRVRRLADTFAHFRDMLYAMAPEGHEGAGIAMWTPGPMNEVYFEHVYLAKYLGFPLVEGGDLTVRDNRVFLKTIEGLQKIDVIVRRVDDAFCDPLELRRDSTLGAVGLLQAARIGHVALCNAIGSAALQVPAVAAMLPRLSRHLLSEDLLLPSTITLWGGVAEDRARMDADFDRLHLVPAFGSATDRPIVPGELSAADSASLRARWTARPHDFAALAAPTPSAAPVWTSDGLSPRSITLRAFAIGGGRTAHIRVMPGGLARYSGSADSTDISMQRGGGSKDVWVLAEPGAGHRGAHIVESGAPAICRSPANVSSRLAENLMWFGRYCERTEHAVRFLRHVMARCVDDEDLAQAAELHALVEAAPFLFNAAFRAELASRQSGTDTPATGNMREAMVASVYDYGNLDSVLSGILAIRRTAWIVRERFSDDDWRIVNGFSQEFLDDRAPDGVPALGDTLHSLNQLVRGFAAFSGLVHENMTREPGQVFLEIGRRIERGAVTTNLVSRIFNAPDDFDGHVLRDLLAICDSPMTYRARYGQTIHRSAVLDLLVCDETNPRSVAFQINALVSLLGQLPEARRAGMLRHEERTAERLRTALRVADPAELTNPNATGRGASLKSLLDWAATDISRLADLVGLRYFIHTAAPRQLDPGLDRLVP